MSALAAKIDSKGKNLQNLVTVTNNIKYNKTFKRDLRFATAA